MFVNRTGESARVSGSYLYLRSKYVSYKHIYCIRTSVIYGIFTDVPFPSNGAERFYLNNSSIYIYYNNSYRNLPRVIWTCRCWSFTCKHALHVYLRHVFNYFPKLTVNVQRVDLVRDSVTLDTILVEVAPKWFHKNTSWT